MRTLLAIAIGVCALLILSTSASTAQTGQSGIRTVRVMGPSTCVRVWMFRSRQTRYAGAPLCRRIPV
jgi:hypothetical protein